MKQYLLFDLDGTVTDSFDAVTSSVVYALEQFGIRVSDVRALKSFIGPPLTESFAHRYGFSEEDAWKAVGYYRDFYEREGIHRHTLYPGMKELLRSLSLAGYTLILVTNKPHVYASQILSGLEVADTFSFVSGCELDGTRASKTEGIRYAMEQCGFKPAQAIMIGDRENDMAGAKACGVESIGVLYGFGSVGELRESGADHMVSTVEELGLFLKRGQRKEQVQRQSRMIRFGVAGDGLLARRFYEANRYVAPFELGAVVMGSEEMRTQMQALSGRVAFFENLEAMADSEEVEAVYLCSAPAQHEAQIQTLLEKGKHVLVSAPLVLKEETARRLFDLAEERELVLMEAVPAIYTRGFDQMREKIRQIGKIRSASFSSCTCSPAQSAHLHGAARPSGSGSGEASPEESGKGALFENGYPAIAAMLRLFGEPKAVRTLGVRDGDGADIVDAVSLSWEEMTGQILCSNRVRSFAPSEIIGEEGSVLIDSMDNVREMVIYRDMVKQSCHLEQQDNIMKYVTDSFMRSICTYAGWKAARDLTLATLALLEKVTLAVCPTDGRDESL